MATESVTLLDLRLVRIMYDDLDGDHYGLALGRAAGLNTASRYTCRARLERMGWVIARWEDIDPVTEGRPARKFYRLTAQGMEGYRAQLQTIVSPALRGIL